MVLEGRETCEILTIKRPVLLRFRGRVSGSDDEVDRAGVVEIGAKIR